MDCQLTSQITAVLSDINIALTTYTEYRRWPWILFSCPLRTLCQVTGIANLSIAYNLLHVFTVCFSYYRAKPLVCTFAALSIYHYCIAEYLAYYGVPNLTSSPCDIVLPKALHVCFEWTEYSITGIDFILFELLFSVISSHSFSFLFSPSEILFIFKISFVFQFGLQNFDTSVFGWCSQLRDTELTILKKFFIPLVASLWKTKNLESCSQLLAIFLAGIRCWADVCVWSYLVEIWCCIGYIVRQSFRLKIF